MSTVGSFPGATPPPFDRLAALQAFDATRAGVKGLVDSGTTSIPAFFHHPPSPSGSSPPTGLSIPTVDLSLPNPIIVRQIRSAASDWGFFQVTNHGVPLDAISAVRSFNELPAAVRSSHYSREFIGGVSYASNFDLFRSAAASWRDTVQIRLSPERPDPDRIPAQFRSEILDLDRHVTRLAKHAMGLLSEGLGVESGRLEGMSCHEGRLAVCHYYPWCPEPDRTVGLVSHTDPRVLTVLMQDGVGALQVKREGYWVDVVPIEGAIVMNVGDLLQIISNDMYKSVQHRVVANSHKEARVSIAVFFNPGKKGEDDLYGPLPELVSSEKPVHYRNFTMPEFMGTFLKKELGSKCLVDHFKV